MLVKGTALYAENYFPACEGGVYDGNISWDDMWYLQSIGYDPVIYEKVKEAGNSGALYDDNYNSNDYLSVTVALIDTGVDYHHRDLALHILTDEGYDYGDNDNDPYDENGHGTMMAGIITAVSPNIKIIPFKINRGGEATFDSTALSEAVIHAVNTNAQIINLSLVVEEDQDIVRDALIYARKMGKVVIAASGNGGREVAFPASLSWVIGVGAVDKYDGLLSLSNRGDAQYMVAPGRDILSTVSDEGYGFVSGTSPAAAIVSGVAAVFMEYFHNDPFQAVTFMLNNAKDIGDNGFDPSFGFGKVYVQEKGINPLIPQFTISTEDNRLIYDKGDFINIKCSSLSAKEKDLTFYVRLNLPLNSEGIRQDLYLRIMPFLSWDGVEIYNRAFLKDELKEFPLIGPPHSSALLTAPPIGAEVVEGPYLLEIGTYYNDVLNLNSKVIWLK